MMAEDASGIRRASRPTIRKISSESWCSAQAETDDHHDSLGYPTDPRTSECVPFQILRRRRDRYVAVAARDGWTRSHVFGRSSRLERRKNRLGRWAYTLEVLPA